MRREGVIAVGHEKGRRSLLIIGRMERRSLFRMRREGEIVFWNEKGRGDLFLE
jgi:hypothetical protein